MKPFLIGLAGISGSGKSTIVDHLEAIGGVKRFRFDAFYKSEADCPKLESGGPNWDLPESLYLEDCYQALSEIVQGHETNIPIYDRGVNDRTGSMLYTPAPIIFAEGLHLFSHDRMRDLFHLRLWIDCDEQEALRRRLERQPHYDMDYHWAVAAPAHRIHVLPLRKYAHRVLDGMQSIQQVTTDTDRFVHEFLGVSQMR